MVVIQCKAFDSADRLIGLGDKPIVGSYDNPISAGFNIAVKVVIQLYGQRGDSVFCSEIVR